MTYDAEFIGERVCNIASEQGDLVRLATRMAGIEDSRERMMYGQMALEAGERLNVLWREIADHLKTMAAVNDKEKPRP